MAEIENARLKTEKDRQVILENMERKKIQMTTYIKTLQEQISETEMKK